MEYQDKVVVITAAGQGIGRAAGLEFARRGASVLVSDSDASRAAKVAQEIKTEGGTARYRSCDVSSDSDVEALADAAFEEWGRVDVLMNHAGLAAMGPVDRIPVQHWRRVLEVGLFGVVRGIQSFLPRMAKQGHGLVVNTSSTLGLFPELSFALPYVTSKAAIIGLSEALFHYAGHYGVRVMVLAPGITDTGFEQTSIIITEGLDPEQMSHMVPRETETHTPQDVVDALMLAIDDGRFLACNVPGYEDMLRRKADELYEPGFRLHPTMAEAFRDHWPVIDC